MLLSSPNGNPSILTVAQIFRLQNRPLQLELIVMAGFAVFVTIVTYRLFGIAVAAVASIALVAAAKRRLQCGVQGRGAFLTMCGFAPVARLIWLVAALLVHVQISNKLTHQDCGLSGDPYVTLPNGYVLGSLST
jgi:hypothetical protein